MFNLILDKRDHTITMIDASGEIHNPTVEWVESKNQIILSIDPLTEPQPETPRQRTCFTGPTLDIPDYFIANLDAYRDVLPDALNVHPTTISTWITRRKMRKGAVVKLCEIYGWDAPFVGG